jgi:hypothetical protein
MGNILIQAIGAGEISGLEAAREIVRGSVELETFTPRPAAEWDCAYGKFKTIARG